MYATNTNYGILPEMAERTNDQRGSIVVVMYVFFSSQIVEFCPRGNKMYSSSSTTGHYRTVEYRTGRGPGRTPSFVYFE